VWFLDLKVAEETEVQFVGESLVGCVRGGSGKLRCSAITILIAGRL